METIRNEKWLSESYIPSFGETKRHTKQGKERDHTCNFIVPWVISDTTEFVKKREKKVSHEAKKKGILNKELTTID